MSSDSWRRAVRMMDAAVQPRDEPVTLATGEWTSIYLDVKGVLTTRERINLAADAMNDHIVRLQPTAIGGPTMGADVLAHAMVSRYHCWDMAWFSVRDRRKTDHGLGLWIEGHRLGPGDRVVLTDDVANSGKSLIEAYERVVETGAVVEAVAPFVDRSGVAGRWFTDRGIEWAPLMTYDDLGLAPLKA